MKRVLCIALAMSMLLSFAACKESAEYTEDENGVRTYYIIDADDLTKENFPEADNSLNAKEIYKSIEYTPEMFYGTYCMNNEEEEFDDFCANTKFERIEYFHPSALDPEESEIEAEIISAVPISIEVGPTSANPYLRTDRTQEWATVTFAATNMDGDDFFTKEIDCTYTVSGNQITFYPLAGYEEIRDDDYKFMSVDYEVGTEGITYDFSFSGPYLTLSKGESSITLTAYQWTDTSSDTAMLAGYKTKDTATVGGLDYFYGCLGDDNYQSGYGKVVNQTEDEYIFDFAMKISTDGLVTITFTVENDKMKTKETFTHQYVYFTGGYSCVLVDEDGVYYYSESSTSRQQLVIREGLTEEELLALYRLTDTELEKIATTKAALLEDLQKAFSEAGITVAIDSYTGELSVDNTVLFEEDKSDLLDDGKTLLDTFVKTCNEVLANEEYKDFISKIIVEGHTDTNGTEEHNKELSTARANVVKDYCVSIAPDMASMYSAVGYAAEKPVYDREGNVDMAASRRVSFRFGINLEALAD